MRCAYHDSKTPRCSGPVIFTMHDARGCVAVCFAHAKWRMTTSVAIGHGAKCPLKRATRR